MSFISELKRRNVFRVATAYVVGSWLIIQVAEATFPAFGFSDATLRLVIVLLAIAFVPTIVLSWAFEITPEGLKREPEVERERSITRVTGKKLDRVIMALLALALGYFLFDRLVLTPAREAAIAEQARLEGIEQAREQARLQRFEEKSVAVLPFVNRSENADDGFFTDGMHDEVLTRLAQIGELKVISRTSVMPYRDSIKPLPQVARELSVATVVEGAVQRAGDQIRVNVQLVNASTDEHLWAQTFDRKLTLTNLFTIQSEIAEAIAAALQATMSTAEQERVQSVPTNDFAAYESYLVGRQLLERRSRENLAEAAVHFERATELDPAFALAWVGLADAGLLQVWYPGTDRLELLAGSRSSIDMALSLSPDLGEAFASRGLLAYAEGDFESANRWFSRSEELSPNYALAWYWHTWPLRELGRWEEALTLSARAVELDPLSPAVRKGFANHLRLFGEYDRALEQYERIIEIEPLYFETYAHIGIIQHGALNRLVDAARNYARSIELEPRSPLAYGAMVQLFLDLGDPAPARAFAHRLNDLAPADVFAAWSRLLLQLYEGDLEATATEAAALQMTRTPGFAMVGQFALAQRRNFALKVGVPAQALNVYADAMPALLDDAEPEIDFYNYRAAIDLALVLQISDDPHRAEVLLERVARYLETRFRPGMLYGYGVADVQVLALQGRHADALEALDRAVDEGWRTLWWYYLRQDPNLASIRKEPAFAKAVEEVENDMAAQNHRVRDLIRSGQLSAIPGLSTDH